MNGKQGFTLIELLVVVLIIGILSSIALPQYTKAVQKARGTEAMIAGRTLANAENIYYMGEKLYTRDLTALDIEMPELKYFELGSKNLDKVIDTYTAVGNEPVATFALYSKKDDAEVTYTLKSGKVSSISCAGADCRGYFACKSATSTGCALE